MAEKQTEHASCAELIFVAAAFLLAGGAITGAVLRERGIGFAPPIAEIIYRALWTALWLPGIAMGTRLNTPSRTCAELVTLPEARISNCQRCGSPPFALECLV